MNLLEEFFNLSFSAYFYYHAPAFEGLFLSKFDGISICENCRFCSNEPRLPGRGLRVSKVSTFWGTDHHRFEICVLPRQPPFSLARVP